MDKSDLQVLQDVLDAMEASQGKENWRDFLPAYIKREGSFEKDPRYIGHLSDGRIVAYEDAKGESWVTVYSRTGKWS